MPRKLNKRKKIQAIKRKAGLAPPARKSIYERPRSTNPMWDRPAYDYGHHFVIEMDLGRTL